MQKSNREFRSQEPEVRKKDQPQRLLFHTKTQRTQSFSFFYPTQLLTDSTTQLSFEEFKKETTNHTNITNVFL